MTFKPFIPKDNPDIPDRYGMKITYVTGKVEEIVAAQHFSPNEQGILDICTQEDRWLWINMQNVLKIEFDKNFSKLIELANKREAEKKAKTDGLAVSAAPSA